MLLCPLNEIFLSSWKFYFEENWGISFEIWALNLEQGFQLAALIYTVKCFHLLYWGAKYRVTLSTTPTPQITARVRGRFFFLFYITPHFFFLRDIPPTLLFFQRVAVVLLAAQFFFTLVLDAVLICHDFIVEMSNLEEKIMLGCWFCCYFVRIY